MTQHPSFQNAARTTALALAAVAAVLGLLVLGADWQQHGAADRAAVDREARVLAQTLAGIPERRWGATLERAAKESGVAIVGADGQTKVAAGLPAFSDGPLSTLSLGDGGATVEVGGRGSYRATAVPLGQDRLLYARPATPWPWGVPLLLALLITAAVAGAAYSFVRRAVGESARAAAEDLSEISRRVAGHQFAEDAEARLKAEAQERFGAVVDPLFSMSDALTILKTRLAALDGQMKAMLHVNPHYVVIVRGDGKVADANPAFFAMSGLPAQKVRGASVKAISNVLALDPLAKHAARASSGATVQGIDYHVVDKGGRKRRVKISMRKLRFEDTDALVVQATDIQRERELQHQVDDFFDTFDIKVEEAVTQRLTEAPRPQRTS